MGSHVKGLPGIIGAVAVHFLYSSLFLGFTADAAALDILNHSDRFLARHYQFMHDAVRMRPCGNPYFHAA